MKYKGEKAKRLKGEKEETSFLLFLPVSPFRHLPFYPVPGRVLPVR